MKEVGGAGRFANHADLGANATPPGRIIAGILIAQEGNSRVGLTGNPNDAGTPYDFTAAQNTIAENTNGTSTHAQAALAFGDPNQKLDTNSSSAALSSCPH
ncbi:MAG: hypothetical protein J0H01_36160 [Rhizobiales bacterium]|nr:hypothetical protein [Hyphomicrobiales bacterium]